MKADEFLLNLPKRVDPAAIAESETCFHFNLSAPDACQLTVRIDRGKIEVLEGLQYEPKCVVGGSGENFMKVINRELNPMMALLMGKIKFSNQGELVRYAKIFGLMK